MIKNYNKFGMIVNVWISGIISHNIENKQVIKMSQFINIVQILIQLDF